MPKRLLIRKIHELFIAIQAHPWYIRIHDLPFWVKITIAIMLGALGILGMILPFLPGFIFIGISIVLILGIHRTKKLSLKTIYFTRAHIFFSRIYLWWKKK